MIVDTKIFVCARRSSGRECAVSTENLVWSFLMYTSYFYLFSRCTVRIQRLDNIHNVYSLHFYRFFYLSYFKPGGNKSIKKD